MMLWCEMHSVAGIKGGVTNFDPSEYDKELPWLQSVSQVGPAPGGWPRCEAVSESLAVLGRSRACRPAAGAGPPLTPSLPSLPPARPSQDQLIEALRSDGRKQAAHRMLRHKRDPSSTGGLSGEECSEDLRSDGGGA
jgi:hypothetical protein